MISAVALVLFVYPVAAEIVVITKPLPDSKGELWPREYFDVNFAIFVMPQRFLMDNGVNKIPVRPQITKHAGDPEGGPVVEKAWINIIDLERKRYFSGRLDDWFELDSTEVLQIREGYDTCIVRMRSCDQLSTPGDSCRTVGVVLNDSLNISDISYIVYTAFNYNRRAKPGAYAEAGYYYRAVLNYITHEVPLEQVIDMTPMEDSAASPVDCNCIRNFGIKSVLKVMYRGEYPSDTD
jgi:hypothetical protein